MNILDKIVERKKVEVADRKSKRTLKELEASPLFSAANLSLKKFLLDPERTGIIAEFKKKSPSKGIINANALPEVVTKQYEEAGASAVSVLTDIDFFGGSDEDLARARKAINIPILRKDFIVDEYQIVEAKAMGANVILLIAACLPTEQVKQFSEFTHSLGMEVLLEVHNEEELFANLYPSIDVVGVNNRNLKDFSVSIETSIRLAELIPAHYLKISESGISDVASITKLRDQGFNGFLIGENFMRTADPGEAMKKFVKEIKEQQTIK